MLKTSEMEARRTRALIMGKPMAITYLHNQCVPHLILQWPRAHTDKLNDQNCLPTMTWISSPFMTSIPERDLWIISNRPSCRRRLNREKTGSLATAPQHRTASNVPYTNCYISSIPKGRWPNKKTGKECLRDPRRLRESARYNCISIQIPFSNTHCHSPFHQLPSSRPRAYPQRSRS